MKHSDILKAAKQHLCYSSEDAGNSKSFYICNAVSIAVNRIDIAAANPGMTGQEYEQAYYHAKQMEREITDHISTCLQYTPDNKPLVMEGDRPITTLGVWLRKMGTGVYELPDSTQHIQAHRHAWLDMLIADYEAIGK